MSEVVLNIDELNINKPYKDRSEPYEQYFGIMALSKRQIRERILLAEDLEDIFMEFLMLMSVLHDYGLGYNLAQEQLETQYRDKMFEWLPVEDSPFIYEYAAAYAVNAVETTVKHFPESGGLVANKRTAKKIKDKVEQSLPSFPTSVSLRIDEIQPEETQPDNWYLSVDRAKFNAENEANTVLNRGDYLKAVEAGYNFKRWITEADERVRPTHQEVEGVTIPIDGIFVVGDSLFDYPKSLKFSPSPSEYVNCRCVTEYLK